MSEAFNGQALRPYNKTDTHLLKISCNVTSSDTVLPTFPGTIGSPIKGPFRASSTDRLIAIYWLTDCESYACWQIPTLQILAITLVKFVVGSRSFLTRSLTVCASEVCIFYFVIIYFLNFSRATVSAVLRPCRTCHMLFVLLARCVVCVLGK